MNSTQNRPNIIFQVVFIFKMMILMMAATVVVQKDYIGQKSFWHEKYVETNNFDLDTEYIQQIIECLAVNNNNLK